jgi:hypothetical protein
MILNVPHYDINHKSQDTFMLKGNKTDQDQKTWKRIVFLFEKMSLIFLMPEILFLLIFEKSLLLHHTSRFPDHNRY